MSAPFFSIVIPTKDRPQFILDAVISAAGQRFEGFEVIVSDNSASDTTREVLYKSVHARQVTYIRPPRELAMPDHWEFATSQAAGQYVLVLTDRSVLRQGALTTIHQAIEGYGRDSVQVCAWRWSLFDDELGVGLSWGDGSGTSLLRSADVVAEFAAPQKEFPYKLPRALNSCYSAAIAAKIRAIHGRLFFPMNPDFTSAFLLLAYAPKLTYIDAPLFISRGLGSSTGANAYRSSETGYLHTLGLTDWYRHVPIKAVLADNLLFEDFLAMREMAGRGIAIEIDWAEYFIRCYKEILGKKGQDILSRQHIAKLQSEWERALGTMDDGIKRRVLHGVRSMRALRFRTAIREVLCEMGLLTKIRHLRSLFLSSPKGNPTTVLAAAGHDAAKHIENGT